MTQPSDAGVETALALITTGSLTGGIALFLRSTYWREKAHYWEDRARRRPTAAAPSKPHTGNETERFER